MMSSTERECRAAIAYAFSDWHYSRAASSLERFALLNWLMEWAGIWVSPQTETYHPCRFHGGPHDGEIVNVHDAYGYFHFARPRQHGTDAYKRTTKSDFWFVE